MKYQPDIHHRRSIRLKDYDYSQENAYFVTICAQNKQCLFGEIQDGKMHLNHAGTMTIKWYQELPNKFTRLQCNEFVCMPNHIHFIIKLIDTNQQPVGVDLRVRPDECDRPDNHVRPNENQGQTRSSEDQGQTHRSAPTGVTNLPAIVQWYKTMTTNEYIRGVKQNGWQPFNGKLWQRNYWERIIRNENEFNQIRDYIQTNPMRWEQDKLHTTQSQQPVGANLRVRPIQPTNNINLSVGAHPRVRPDKPQGQTSRSEKSGQTHEKSGQTHRSAPTASPMETGEVVQS